MPVETDPFDLDIIGVIEGTDKSSAISHSWDYLRHYQRLFERWRDEPINLVEIGVQGGFSLKVWQAYFTRATIVGIDIDPACARFASDRTIIEIGSQDDPELLNRVLTQYPPTIFVDDGSHLGHHVIYTFEHAFPALCPGGLYVAEDLAFHLAPDAERWKGESEIPPPDYFLELARSCLGRRYETAAKWGTRRYLPDQIAEIAFFSGAAVIRKRQDHDVATALRLGTAYLHSQSAPANGHAHLAEYIMRHGGPLEEAERHARRAIEIGGERPSLVLVLAEVLVRTNRQDDAVTLLERACRTHPNRFELWRRRGAIESERRRPLEAAAALEQAISLRPDDARTRLDLSSALERAGKLDEALAAANAAMTVAAGSPLAERCGRQVELLRARLAQS
jgi:Tetratricopeptide repeat